VYWRPRAIAPAFVFRPTNAWRLKMVLLASSSPLSILAPVSSVKKTEVPLPRSSLPRKPMRDAEPAPLVTLVWRPALPPLSPTMAASAMP
jgi:hypothetical protein